MAGLSAELTDVVHPTEVEGVHLIPGGSSPPNPAELLGLPKMTVLLDDLKTEYDTVLVDSPPVLQVADSSIMPSQVDGVVVVVGGFSTRFSLLRAALDTLRNAHVSILGVVVNKLKPSSRVGHDDI